MFVLRPIGETELPELLSLAKTIEGGMTSLPVDEEYLEDRIHESLRAFSPRIRKPGGESYLFVLEQTETRTLCGTSGIASRVGGFNPFYSYLIQHEKLVHKPSNTKREIPVLHLRETHSGPSELCSLYLSRDYRRAELGRLLSLGRFHFMKTFPHRFDATVIAELRGYIDENNRSPFWEAVGRHFIDYDYHTADFLTGRGDKSFIADLMPKYPIYIPLLPPEVQSVIGRVHKDTEPALAILRAEGFGFSNEVDIFDAGPCVCASVEEIRTVRATQTAVIAGLASVPNDGAVRLLSNGQLNFRACLGAIQLQSDQAVIIAPEVAHALQLKIGDSLYWSTLK